MHSGPEPAASRYSWYVVAVLLAVYMVHHLDRMIVTLLLEPIGREFDFSDSQLGLLAGLAYAVPFAIAGLPLGMLVDRVNRVRLLTVLVTVWSGLTTLAAFANGFWTLLLARVGVAAAEAGGTPTNVSIISDQVPAARRSTAFGVYYMGAALGTIIGFSVAGAIAAKFGWRAGFLVAGLPGLLMAIILWRTVREPPRSDRAKHGATAPPLGPALRMIWDNKPALHVILGTVVMGMLGIGLMTWLPTLMIRNHGSNVGQVGTIMAFAIYPLGPLASLIGGRLGDSLQARAPASVARFLTMLALVTLPAVVAGILSESMTGLVVGFAIQAIAQTMVSAPAYASVMHHVAPGVRGLAASLMQIGTNVLGFGVGTQVIGVASDALHAWSPDQSLRYAMLGFTFTALWALGHFVLAARAMGANSRPSTA